MGRSCTAVCVLLAWCQQCQVHVQHWHTEGIENSRKPCSLTAAVCGQELATCCAAPARRMLAGNFAAMADMGDPVLKPFLQAWLRVCG